jgi:hypothetical protein
MVEVMSKKVIETIKTNHNSRSTLDQKTVDNVLATIWSAAGLGRDCHVFNGEQLALFRIDGRLSFLIPPRGVYADEHPSAQNLMDYPQVRGEVLSSEEFTEAAAEILGEAKLNPRYDSNLDDLCLPAMLAEVLPRTTNNDKTKFHCDDKTIVPVMITLDTDSMHAKSYFNTEVIDHVSRSVEQIISKMTK